MSVDPKRMVEEAGAGQLAAMLRAAHEHVLTEEQAERVRASLVTTVGIGAAGTAAPAAGHTGLFGTSVAAKVGLGLVAVGLVSGAAWFALRASAPASPPSVLVSAPVAPATPDPAAPTVSPPLGAPSTVSSPEPATAVPEEAPPRAPRAPKAAPAPRPAASVALPPLPSSPAPISQSSEGALLLQARRALESDPARALALVREHERQFPDSQLAPERARIAAEAARRLKE